MARYSGICCGCVWDYVYGDLTTDDWDAHLATIRQVIEGGYPEADTFLSITYSLNEISANQKKQLMDVLRSEKNDLRKIKGRALVVDSLAARAAILTLSWILLKSFDLRVFAVPRPAIDWLASRSTQFDGDKVINEIRNTVQREHLWEKI